MSNTLIVLPTPVTLPHVELPVVAFHNAGRTSLPVTTLECWYCCHDVDAADGAHVSRVDGDSRLGYQPIHVACDVENEEDVARDADLKWLLATWDD